MPRWSQTGTGPGDQLGDVEITFSGLWADNRISACEIAWRGSDDLVPLLPAIAFDQYFPNLREIVPPEVGGALVGKDAQRWVLRRFEDWVTSARALTDAGEPPDLFGAIPEKGPDGDEVLLATATFVVRTNRKHERLWGETNYSPEDASDLVFAVIHQLLWDWVVSRFPVRTQETMLTGLARQFDYYDTHGIPADFRMRGIGKAPFAAASSLEVVG